jgi:hypothetical protein
LRSRLSTMYSFLFPLFISSLALIIASTSFSLVLHFLFICKLNFSFLWRNLWIFLFPSSRIQFHFNLELLYKFIKILIHILFLKYTSLTIRILFVKVFLIHLNLWSTLPKPIIKFFLVFAWEIDLVHLFLREIVEPSTKINRKAINFMLNYI